MKKAGLFIGLIVLFSLPLLSSFEFNATSLTDCKTDCREVQKVSLGVCKTAYEECKNSCDDLLCQRNCSKEKTICIRAANSNFKVCKEQCKINVMPRCENGTYVYGETFTKGCDICECGRRGKVSCKREPFCNKNVTVDEKECVEAGGFYQALCNGPYFGIVCSQQEFCLCGGNGNYTCPENYECLMDFVSPNKRKTLEGWKTLLGFPLGEIGVCAESFEQNQNLTEVL